MFYEEGFAEHVLFSSYFITLLYIHIIKVIHKELPTTPTTQHQCIIIWNCAATPEQLNYINHIFYCVSCVVEERKTKCAYQQLTNKPFISCCLIHKKTLYPNIKYTGGFSLREVILFAVWLWASSWLPGNHTVTYKSEEKLLQHTYCINNNSSVSLILSLKCCHWMIKY